MKSTSIVLIASAAIALGLIGYGYYRAVPGPPSLGKIPQIEIVPQSHDFGEIEYGEVAEYTFKIKNSGNSQLEISRISTSCACTSASVLTEKLNPSEETELKVTYDTGTMSGSHAKGKQERIIYVKSNDPLSPQAEALIYADVK